MPINYDQYRNRFQFIEFERDDGVIEIRIHNGGGSAKWSAHVGGLHDELGQAFHCVGQDPENRVVILTGTGDRFLTEVDYSNLEPVTPEFWYRIYKEGKELLMYLLDIEAPVIAAVNGPAFIHAELLTMSDIVIAADTAAFADKAHSVNNVVPGDGVLIWWQMLLGPNRARHFLLTGDEIPVTEAKSLGFVAEVVPPEDVRDRSWQVARELAAKPHMMLRMTRNVFVQDIKRRMLDDHGHGLLLQGLASLDRAARGK